MKIKIICIAFFLPLSILAQIGGTNAFSFIDVAFSARAEAMGGAAIAIVDNDVSLVQSTPSLLNPGYGLTGQDVLGTNMVNINSEANCDRFPYDNCNSNHTRFAQNGQQAKFVWDINDRTTLTYLYGYVDYGYTFNIDLDNSPSLLSQYRTTVLEDVHMRTHEININWMLGDDVEVTSGIFFMDENRQQNYSLSNNVPGILNAASYGVMDVGFENLYPFGIVLGAPGTTVMGVLGWPSDALSPHVR